MLCVVPPPDEDDLPPLADAGQDRVVQPQDMLILNGVKSKDDKALASFEWHQEAGDSTAIIEVGVTLGLLSSRLD